MIFKMENNKKIASIIVLSFSRLYAERIRCAAFYFIFFTCSLLFFNFSSYAQTNVNQNVIGTTSDADTTETLIITSTVGEAIIQTLEGTGSAVVLTQGFQQTFEGGNITFDINITSPLCNERNDGFAEISNFSGCESPYSVTWSNGSSGNRATSLSPGTYTVQVVSDNGCNELFEFEVKPTNDLPCLLKFYSGITPNADGRNDTWIIDNIELFPTNEITFYNRLGNKVWEGKNYDNSTVVWEGENLSGNDLPSDTYFYIFESGSDVEKGWVELTR